MVVRRRSGAGDGDRERLVVITTNQLEKVDAALGRPDGTTGSTRPGRIDRVVELPPLDAAGRDKIARRILRDWPGHWEKVTAEGRGDTGAQFPERCARRALKLHYKGSRARLQRRGNSSRLTDSLGEGRPASSGLAS